MLFDDAFDLWMLVTRHDDEPMLEGSDALVLLEPQLDPRLAVAAPARAEELRAIAVGREAVFGELRGQFVDPPVQLLEQVLVSRKPLPARIFIQS